MVFFLGKMPSERRPRDPLPRGWTVLSAAIMHGEKVAVAREPGMDANSVGPANPVAVCRLSWRDVPCDVPTITDPTCGTWGCIVPSRCSSALLNRRDAVPEFSRREQPLPPYLPACPSPHGLDEPVILSRSLARSTSWTCRDEFPSCRHTCKRHLSLSTSGELGSRRQRGELLLGRVAQDRLVAQSGCPCWEGGRRIKLVGDECRTERAFSLLSSCKPTSRCARAATASACLVAHLARWE